MHLIFGGAYQGKLEYAKERYQLEEPDIYFCSAGKEGEGCPSGPEIDFGKKAVAWLDQFILCCVRSGVEAKEYLEGHRGEWEDAIFLCTDVSAGIVPYEREMRDWREMVGRTLTYLGKEAKEVTRVFCGLPQQLK